MVDLNTTNVSVQFVFLYYHKQSPYIFKYNKCIGSIDFTISLTREEDYLNTTNVSVQWVTLEALSIQALRFKYNKCIGSMCSFKDVYTICKI